MGKKNKLPVGWLDYENVGRQVPGTRFIAFKVPLKETICRTNLKKSDWFTPDVLLETIPSLKLIVNLTNTVSGRYYDYSFFENNGVEILPLKCEGRGTLPPNKLMNTFYCAVDDFLQANAADNDALIGVHCTHGLNRTGLFICKYMVDRMGMPATEAIQHFQTARGHDIERHQYLHAIATSDGTDTPAAVMAMAKNEGRANTKRSKQKEETKLSSDARTKKRKQKEDQARSSGFDQWCKARQLNGYNKLNNYGRNDQNNHEENNDFNGRGYNNQRQNGYNSQNNQRQYGYNNQRQNGYNNYRDGHRSTSRYDLQHNIQEKHKYRNHSHPYSRDNLLTNRNVPPGQKREKSAGRYYASPLDNCYD